MITESDIDSTLEFIRDFVRSIPAAREEIRSHGPGPWRDSMGRFKRRPRGPAECEMVKQARFASVALKIVGRWP